ncbi:MAG: PilZ domain-containing protein [Clostridiaceae bacterium]|nr:PilZ domain-containing protein [Clostridiaceae bacterium]
MNFKVGEIVTLKHYSGKKINKGIISNIEDQKLIIKPEKDFLIYSYFDNDPIVIGLEDEEIICVCEGVINSINYNNNTFTAAIINSESLINRRACQRFPVSLFAYIYHNNLKDFAYIRNLSLEGLSLCTKKEFDKGKILNIDTLIEDKSFNIEAQILWKKDSKFGFEYGLEYSAGEESFVKCIEKHIQFFKSEQENAIRMLNYEFDSLLKTISKKISMN